jgi:tricorn protease
MNRVIPLGLLLALVMSCSLAAAAPARFMQFPDIHGDTVVFTYEGDLWRVDAGGGTARRLTSFPGEEFAARFSPDGRWIAFTASYDGAPAVYRMPAEGGEPKRLTYMPGYLQTLGWTPDGEEIYFRSSYEQFIYRDPNLYFVDVQGHAPVRFPIDRGVLASFSPDGTKMLYCRKGLEEYQWKRYKGGRYQDIWMYDFRGKVFTPISDYVGKNSYPMWVGNTMYYVSDRDTGVANLYAEDLASRKITPVTRYDKLDVMQPETDGRRIVYLQDGFVHVLDIASGQDRKLDIRVESDRWRLRDRVINPKDYIQGMTVANDGQSAVLEARGDLFLVPAGKGQTRNLSDTPGSRERYGALSPDGQWVAFFSDKTGDYQLYLQKAAGGEWTPLTTQLDRAVYHLVWSPDGTKILFGNKNFDFFILDVATKELTKFDESHQLKNDEFYWEISDYNWSPDSRWVCYTKVAYNRNSVVMLYSLDQKKAFDISGDFYDNLNPRFDAAGDYLYFLSSRNFDVQMDFYEDNHILATPYQVMAVQLRAGEKPPFLEGEDETAKRRNGETAKEEKKGAEKPAFRIDLAGIGQRVWPLPVEPGNFLSLQAGKGKVAWLSVPTFTEDDYENIFQPGNRSKYSLHLFDMDTRKEAVLEDKIRDYELSTTGEQALLRKDNNFYLAAVDKLYQSKKLGDKLSLDGMLYTIDTRAEWAQIFNDTWRWYRDFFYDAAMHGHDWKAVGDLYRACLPDISSRSELNWLMSQMVGELCVGHAYIGGGDDGPDTVPEPVVYTGRLGADLEADPASGYYKFAKIYGPTEYDRDLKAPLVRPDIQLQEGDYLIAIDGHAVRVPDDYFRLLQVAKGQKVAVTVNSIPSADNARTYEVELLRSDRDLRYNRWLAGNIHKVLEATGGRVGYMHINDMSSHGIAEFDKFWRAFRYLDGIIIDVRRNSGGWTEYFLIDKLDQVQVGYNVLRNMAPFRYPGSAGNRCYVAISNEYNGSDGECFIEHFKARHLGTVVGVPSWGGLVGIVNGQLTLDNGRVQQPNNSFYGKEGKWWVENHGADPDIVIDNDPAAVMAGRDPQLEKAIEAVLKEIKEKPAAFPPVPAYPKR